MPVDKAKVLKLIEMMDNFLRQRELDRSDEDRDTDPLEFRESPSAHLQRPVAEPPDPLTDGAPQRIHGAGRKDLFS